MAVSKILCNMDDLGTAVKEYGSQGCSVKWQLTNGCAVMDCPGTSEYDLEAPATDSAVSRGPHDGIDSAYADYWGEIPE